MHYVPVASGTTIQSLLDAAILAINATYNGTYNIQDQLQSQYNTLIPYVILTIDQPIMAQGGDSGKGYNTYAQAGFAGYSAIQTGILPTGTILNIINNSQILAGGGGGGGAGDNNKNGGMGGGYSNNGMGGSGIGGTLGGINGAGGQGGLINNGNGGGGGSWGNGGGGGSEEDEGAGGNGIKGAGGTGGNGGGGRGGDGGCAIEIPSSSLNGITINITNNGIIAGRVLNQLPNGNYNNNAIIHNGRAYCYK